MADARQQTARIEVATTRIHDLAAEFGISSEQLMGMLKEMDIFVRSHLTPLKDEQVSLMRARGERDKRKLKQPAAPPKRRRAAKAAEPAPEPVAAGDSRPRRRRRTAAEVAAAEAAEAERARLALESAVREQEEEKAAPSLEERAAALFKDLAPTATSTATEVVESPPAAPSTPVFAPPPGAASSPPPRPFIPTPVRPRPVARGTPSGPGAPTAPPPRPVASAAPGAPRRAEREREKTLVRVTEFVTVSELASTLKVPPTQIVTFAFKELGQMVTINQRLDFDMIELIASAFGFQAVREEEYATTRTEAAQDAAETLKPRPPIVTIMGHVDHGKTSLLDYVRKANVVAGEAGGITQHIGAYQVTLKDGRKITFLDTPGHEAFTAMRARGAQVTDIVVLVVAADDAIMPQTIEAISHAKNAGVPLVVAINKIDLPTANVQKVKQDLLAHGVVLEEFGGTTLATAISAKTGKNVQELLDQILLQAELLDLKANPDRRAQGTVLEATLDPGKGPLAPILVQNGTLRGGDDFICGQFYGRVRAMYDERGQTVDGAGPSTPVQVLGFEGVPEAGDTFQVMTDAAAARDIAQKRQRLEREAQHRRTGRVKTLEDFMAERAEGGAAALRIIIKADQGGPAEALADALAQLSTAEVKVEVVHRGVGAITESDVLLARASGAIIVGFHVRPDSNARAAADRERVEIRTYRIIYEAVEEVKLAMEGLLAPEKKEVVLGEA